MEEEKAMKQSEARDWMRMEIESSSRNEEFARVTAAVFLSRLDPTLEEINDVIHGYEGGAGVIYIEAQTEGRDFVISIRDEGKGIEDVARAMEPMYTSDTTGERSGMGFSFMEAFMDEVAVDSQPGRGTRVTMKKKIGR